MTYHVRVETTERGGLIIDFRFDIEPQQQERPRATGRGKFIRVYDPPNTAKFKRELRRLATIAMRGKERLSGALQVEIVFARKVQKSLSKKERALRLTGKHRPTVKPDIDNYTKSTLDALNGVLWDDDAQIVRMILDKIYTDTPAVIVRVKEWRKQDDGL